MHRASTHLEIATLANDTAGRAARLRPTGSTVCRLSGLVDVLVHV